jgi:uncharacterized protein YndB with AHSA1/START domain
MTVESESVEGEAVFPVSVDELWDALTDPQSVADWFGATVTWELTPGGDLEVHYGEGNARRGVIGEVLPYRRLRYWWWPVEDDQQVSEVTYALEPRGAETVLIVTERRAGPTAACAVNSSAADLAAVSSWRWSEWDTRLVHLWARAQRVTDR